MPYQIAERRLAAVAKLLPPPAMIEFVKAANAAEDAGAEHNECMRTAWAEVRKRWERKGRQFARRKMDPTPSDVHVPVPFGSGPKPKKKKPLAFEVDSVPYKKGLATLYVNRPLLNGDDIRAWAAEQGFESALPADDMHVTIAFSKKEVDWDEFEVQTDTITVDGGPREVKQFPPRLTENGATVLRFESPELHARWGEFIADGASWDFPQYQPHITITYKATPEQVAAAEPYTGPLIFGPEEFDEVRQDLSAAGNGGDKVEFPEEPLSKAHDVTTLAVKVDAPQVDGLIAKLKEAGALVEKIEKAGARHSRADQEQLQAAHDAIVKAGAQCPGAEDMGTMKTSKMIEVPIVKLDDEQRMVWGWANVITVKGEPVLDEQADIIEPDTLEKATTEFMKDVRVHAAMHRYEWVIDSSDDLVEKAIQIGTVVHSLPLTYGLAKLLGIDTDVEGWIVGVHVANDTEWAKYKDGTYKSFSIGGRSEFHPLESAALT